ncbi:hypothetical protein I4U23_019712 [Adineta vaga]|nr:hypothetical protein I4U23_019712 [Adineta vaga]
MAKLLTSLKTFFSNQDRNLNQKKTKQCDIECIAIDQSGDIGSMYSRYHDRMLGKLHCEDKRESKDLNGPIVCKLYHGRTIDSQNLLKMVGIDASMRLSIMLNLTQPTGIAFIINYSQIIDQYTRFLYIYHESRSESYKKNLLKYIESNGKGNIMNSTTHIITKIVYGVHAVLVLQLPPAQAVEIDTLLERIRHNLANHECFIELKQSELDLLDKLVFITIHSNIPTLPSMNNFYDTLYRVIHTRDSTEHRRMKYTLTPFQPRKSEPNSTDIAYTIFEESEMEPLEYYLLQHSAELKILQFYLKHELPELLQGKLNDRLVSVQKGFEEIKQFCHSIIRQIGELFVEIRENRDVMKSIDEIVNSDNQKTIDYSTSRFSAIIDELRMKGKQIRQLQNDGFEYYEMTELGIDEKSTDELVKEILFKGDINKRIFCSTDQLQQRSKTKWNEKQSQLVKERQENPQLTLIYADFTYTNLCLKKIFILSSKEQTIDRYLSRSTEPVKVSKKKVQPVPEEEYISILLLGESGVGKSTFINAFANYLRYQTLAEAESNDPFVIIPVSFLMTINDNFDEKLIKFGDVDANEDHSHSGQSVTQQCRCYIFNISHKKKLRIIDTPGFGDTRGVDQDECNMKMIFSFLHHFPYLNGICFLFKPNVQQLNPFLYSCFTQLFRFFGENIRQHFMFCFTNARSTFFAPGDTRPALLSFFNSFPIKNIPFDRNNTFCFDSESFRYLVSLQNSLTFEGIQREEFEKSWTQSVQQSKRFEQYLDQNLLPYRKNKEWQSIQEAQIQINLLILPILEAIRNIIRNISLHSIHSAIELKAISIEQSMLICYLNERPLTKFGSLFVLTDHLHSLTTQCISKQHVLVTYRLEYNYCANITYETIDDLKQQAMLLCQAATKFAHFLKETQVEQGDDPFLSGFVRMIQEENIIYHRKNQTCLNQQLAEELDKLKTQYEQFYNTKSNETNKSLSDIYSVLELVQNNSMIKEQWNAIKQYQQRSIIDTEKVICNDSNRF